MHEFDLIARHLAPLAAGFPGSLNLTDDAALLTLPPGQELVVTKDALAQGVHFFGSEDPALIAQKALRVNLSDLAAMGASPLCYFLALMLPPSTDEAWMIRFCEGLKDAQAAFGLHLSGGDTIATQGTLSLSVTALGTVPTGHALKRSGAKTGDAVYVSGTLGDSALGLASLRNGKGQEWLEQRYLLPQPRLALGQALRGIAGSCMDISDGLVQDMGHICHASSVGATLHLHGIPLSDAARACGDTAYDAALSGGDDYELLFTVPAEKIHLLPQGCTRIGEITAGNSVQVVDKAGTPITLERSGYTHF